MQINIKERVDVNQDGPSLIIEASSEAFTQAELSFDGCKRDIACPFIHIER